MNATEIAVVVMASLLFGCGLTILGVFCYWMIRMMKGLQESASTLTSSSSASLADAKLMMQEIRDLAERNLGEKSPLNRAAWALAAIDQKFPEMLGGLKEFNRTMAIFNNNAFVANKTRPVTPENKNEGVFYASSEEAAAQNEITRNARAERMDLTPTDLSSMRSEDPVADRVKELLQDLETSP